MHRANLIVLLSLLAFPSALASAATTAPAARPPAPTRDPHAPGFVEAKDLPDGTIPPLDVDGNFILGPTHPRAAESDPHEGVPRGTIREFVMRSQDSKIYPGITRDPADVRGTADPEDPTRLIVTNSHPAPYTRKVTVYIPAHYDAAARPPAPLIVRTDGRDDLLFTVLDNLIAQKRVPAMIAVCIAHGGGDGQGSQRGLEYDTMSATYAEFVETEVLPRVEKEFNVKLTRDPNARAAMGVSSGAACAMAMAWYRPDLYRRVLSYSGTFVNQQWPHSDAAPHGAWEFHEHLIPQSDRKPLRLWLMVADRDNLNPNPMRDNMHDWVIANENMAKVLAAKAYPYQFVFARNANHGDKAVRAQTLPEAIEYLWHGYAHN